MGLKSIICLAALAFAELRERPRRNHNNLVTNQIEKSKGTFRFAGKGAPKWACRPMNPKSITTKRERAWAARPRPTLFN